MVRDIRVIMVKLADRTHNMRTLGVDAAGEAPRRRARDARHLRARSPTASASTRSSSSSRSSASARCIRSATASSSARCKRARGNQQRVPAEDREGAAQVARDRRRQRPRRGAREAPVQHLREDAAQARCRCRRSSTCSASASSSAASTSATARSAWCTACTGRCRGASRTTSRSRGSTATSRCTRRCSAPTARRSRCRSAPRTCTGSPSPASPRTGSTRPARSEGESQQARAREWLQNVMDLHEGSAEEFLESVKVDLFPDKVYVFTPKGDIMRLPRGATLRRLRLRGAHRRRQALRRRQGRPAPRAAAHRAAQRPDRGDHHRQGRAAEPRVGELRRHGEGALRDPPVPQEPEARRGRGARRAHAEPGARGIRADAQEAARGPPRRGRALARAEGRPGAARESRPRRAPRARWSRAACCRTTTRDRMP